MTDNILSLKYGYPSILKKQKQKPHLKNKLVAIIASSGPLAYICNADLVLLINVSPNASL